MWHWLRAIHRYSGELGVQHAIIVIMLPAMILPRFCHAAISAVNQISSEHGNHSLISSAGMKGRALRTGLIKASARNMPSAIRFLVSSLMNWSNCESIVI